MSVTTRFKRIIRNNDAKLTILHNAVLVAGALLAFGALDTASYRALAGEARPATIAMATAPGDGAPAAKPASPTLSPRMRGALDYVEERYDVSGKALRPVFEAVQRFATERNVDPLLVVAVIAVESRFDPAAKGGSARGLMQIIPRYHMDKMPEGYGRKALFDPIINVRVGTHILDESISRRGSVVAGLQSYNGSAHGRSYARKVLAVKARLEGAARSRSAESRSVAA